MEPHEILKEAYHVESDYEEAPHIEERDLLSQYPQILNFVIQILTIARAGGMTEKRFYDIGGEILAAYDNLRGDSFFGLRDGLVQILLEDDVQSEAQELEPQKLSEDEKLGGRN